MRSLVQWTVSAAVALGAAAPLAGCADVLGIEETSLGEESVPAGRDWRCVGRVPTPTTSKNIVITVKVTDFSGNPLAGLEVKACAVAANVSCDSPIRTAASGSDGIASLDIPASAVPFTGYLRLEGDANRVPYISYYSRPIAETLADPIPFLSVTWDELDSAIPGATAIPGRGHLFINAADCKDDDAPGIRFDITSSTAVDDLSVPFYVTISGFSTEATQTVGGPGVGGRGGVFNLVAQTPPSLVRFKATSEDTGGVVATADWWILPDTLTTGRLLPQ
jgi:hypothetical protein